MRTLAVGAALAALLFAGCGQKGPLYLPDETGEVITRPTQTPEALPPEQPPLKDKESKEEKPPQS